MTKREVTDRVFDVYSVEPDHPFAMDYETCVFRHEGSRKWFALIMRIPYRTLGISREGCTDILNLKCDPVLAGSLRGRPGYRPAYHMNKDRWITVLLDGTAEREDIIALIAMSYDLTAPKTRKDNRRTR